MIIRNLKAHDELVLRVIRDQAGTVEKAALEAIMNAIEAGSSTVLIGYTPHTDSSPAHLTFDDKGKGFRSRTEIEEWFEKFGKPHSEEENKIWAKFRIGRGQGFAFGRNTWRTGEFKMVVDVNKMGVAYELHEGLEHHPGCHIDIELYNDPIDRATGSYNSVDAFKAAIKRQIEFMEGSICFNGEQLNTPASTLKWDMEDDNAYYMFGKGHDLTIYNKGAFVMGMDAASAGVTGVIVSKKLLEVNFARNDIIRDRCQVFRHIQAVIRENRVKKIRKERRSLDDNERSALLIDLRDGRIDFADVRALSLIKLSNGQFISMDKMRLNRQPWTIAEAGDPIADRLMYLEQAVCVNQDVLDMLDYSGDPDKFFNWLLREAFAADSRYRGGMREQWELVRKLYRSYDRLSTGFSTTNTILPPDKVTPAESRILRVLQSFDCWGGRAICIGISDTALAWTDGYSYIALARSYLEKTRPTSAWGASHVLATLFHELAHDDSTEGSHHHGMEFYRRFHDLVAGPNRAGAASPMYHLAYLPDRLKNLKVEDWTEKQVRKQEKKKAARDKALGIGVPVIPQPVVEVSEIEAPALEEDEVVQPKTFNPGIRRRKMRRV